MSSLIREAQESDFEALCRLFGQGDALHARIRPEFFRVAPGQPRTLRSITEALARPDEVLLVAEVAGSGGEADDASASRTSRERGRQYDRDRAGSGGEADDASASRTSRERGRQYDRDVVGVVHVKVFETPPSPLRVMRRRGHVDDLVVAEEHRRRGLGRALMERAARWCREQGASQLLLTVWDGNEAAEAFYARLGYRPVSRVLGLDLGDGSK